MAQSIHERLRYPPTLNEGDSSLEDLKAKVEQRHEEKEEARERGDTKDPKKERRYTFPFRFVEGSGEIRSGTFTSQVLTIRDQVRAGALTADLLGGAPIEAVPLRARNLAVMLGMLAYALVGERPKWAQDILSLDNYALVAALFGEVVAHHSTFHGGTDEGQSTAG